eukprot:349751-Chlamydomonas_euryale.AAC.1
MPNCATTHPGLTVPQHTQAILVWYACTYARGVSFAVKQLRRCGAAAPCPVGVFPHAHMHDGAAIPHRPALLQHPAVRRTERDGANPRGDRLCVADRDDGGGAGAGGRVGHTRDASSGADARRAGAVECGVLVSGLRGGGRPHGRAVEPRGGC